jgi:hypothetical protein
MKVVALLLLASSLQAQQVADQNFKPVVQNPAYKEGAAPVILLDEAHHNFHTVNGRYSGFAKLARADGYQVIGNRDKFSAKSLSGARILVIANAVNKRNDGGGKKWSLPTPSAFDKKEIEAVREWVRGGGSLMLIADHMPFGGAATDLAAEFGVHMSNGFAMQHDVVATGGRGRGRGRGGAPAPAEAEGRAGNGIFVHTRASGALADDPITRGVDSVKIFTGQGFRIDSGRPLLTITTNAVLLLPDVAWQFTPSTPTVSARGLLQGAVVAFGKGRVAAFGEAAMFSAQVTGPNRAPMGMNDPGAAQNQQFLLNVLHWLSGLP